MRKIYFTKQEIQIGQNFDYKGLNVIITDELIQDNPHLFEIEGSSRSFESPTSSEGWLLNPFSDDWKSTLITEVGLDNRAINALKRAGIETLGELSKKSIYQIRSINNVGKILYKDIINMMNREIPKEYIIK